RRPAVRVGVEPRPRAVAARPALQVADVRRALERGLLLRRGDRRAGEVELAQRPRDGLEDDVRQDEARRAVRVCGLVAAVVADRGRRPVRHVAVGRRLDLVEDVLLGLRRGRVALLDLVEDVLGLAEALAGLEGLELAAG